MKEMLFMRLLPIILVITNTWLLGPVRSHPPGQYKRVLVRRADGELARLAGEPCAVSRVQGSRRQTSQHHPPVAKTRTRRQVAVASRSGPAAGEGARGGDIARAETLNRVEAVDALEAPKRTHPSGGEVTDTLREESRRSASSRRSRSARSIHGTFLYQEESNSSWGKVTAAASDVIQAVESLQQGDVLSTTDPPEVTKDSSSGELEETDSQSSLAEVNAVPWGSPVPKVGPSRMTTLYFHGRREHLRLRPGAGLELPRDEFTVELWIKPEGGQRNPAIIAGVFDNCSRSFSEKGWSVGFRTVESAGTKDSRFYFTLRTDRAIKSTTVYSHQRYRPNVWSHLMATYNGYNMTLYVDGAKVGESSLQMGDLYSPFMKTCRTLFLGSNQSEQGQSFRGYVGGISLWDRAHTHQDLHRLPLQIDNSAPVLNMWADFTNVHQLWTPFKAGPYPTIVTTPFPDEELVSPFLPPPCGLTLCDNMDIILGYNNHWQLRGPKHARYRVVNLSDDNGENPTVSQDQIHLQHKALTEAFRPYNISLELSIHTVRNSSLRKMFILSNCRIAKIGNRQCDPECDHPRTGHDGGDCLRLGPCYNWKRRNGVCNMECNSIRYDYDDGDCCDPEVTDVLKTCFDPESPDRAYMSVKELKDELHLSGSDTLNVFFASNSVREELAGAATWPWAKEALTHHGGMVLNPLYFGKDGHHNTMIHEMGHIFGLYHVFKGVSERDSCDDPCREMTPSMETGDLCADTAPTTKSKSCHDPGAVNDSCGVVMYQNTPFNNYMSYTDDNCTNHFTPNQVARMHCYLDLVYQKWLIDAQPVPVPLAPIVMGQSPDSVSFYWLPPVRGSLHQSSSRQAPDHISCRDCERDGVFHQYAYEASSPRICHTSGYWTPEEAVGPPDVEQPCEPSLQAWSPELSLFDTNVTSPCPETEGCTLTLKFLYPMVPHTLTLWVTYISTQNPAIADIELISDSAETINIGPQHVFCDMPLTLRLDSLNIAVSAIKLCTFDEKMEIDAAMLSSGPGSPLCADCRPVLYHVQRQPPLSNTAPAPQSQQVFTDSSVLEGETYQYTIQVEAGGIISEPSPLLVYTHGQSYCGDSFVQRTEECDDGNLLDGDGCDKKCHKESGFNCVGEPSQCYVFDGDGVCEEFERGSSVQDCGYFTPLGYTDQWASTAVASHQDSNCPAHAATGEPSLTKLCTGQHLEMNEKLAMDAWFPCTALSDTHNDLEHSIWLKVGFVHPGVAASVIIYLASDGSWFGEECRRTATVLLSDTTGKNHSLGTHDLSCHRNPLVVNVTHDLSRPFFLTASVILIFSSPSVAIGGVALRTSCHFSTFALTGCASQGGLSHNFLILKVSCLRQPCQLDTCSPPQLEHATVRCAGGEESSRCFVQCQSGYGITVLQGKEIAPNQLKAELECFHGTWDRVVSCQPVDCGLPDQSHIYHAIFSCPWGTTYRKGCSFTCGSPAILQGDNDRLVCLEDGLWSFPEAYCKIECPEAPNVQDAKLLTADCLVSGHDVGSVCRYKCNPGYYVRGSVKSKTPRKYFRLECLDEGQWEERSCEPMSCPAISNVFHDMYTCTNGLFYDSMCTLHCPDATENSVIRCTKDGDWTAEFAMCSTIQGSCSAPPDLNSVEYSCDFGTDVGAICYPTCIVAVDMDLRDPAVLPNGTTADSLTHWMLPTKIESIVCTGMKKWYPDPQQVHCVQSCEPFGGDGWCDTINNRAFCQYDGGDCCPSTLSSKKVIQFGVDCTEDECTCRDPEADENKNKKLEDDD